MDRPNRMTNRNIGTHVVTGIFSGNPNSLCPQPFWTTATRACLRSEGSEPFADAGDVEGCLVADGELVVAGGDGAVALEPADAALDGVALLVLLFAEGGGPAS